MRRLVATATWTSCRPQQNQLEITREEKRLVLN